MEKSQREFLLRQQLAAIRKELGEGEPEGADDYRARVEAADVPDAVRAAAAPRGRQARAVQRPEPGDGVDPDLARHRARAAVARHAPTTPPTSSRPAPCSTPTTTASTRSRTGSSSTSPSAPAAPSAASQVVGGRGSGAVILLAGPPGVGKTSLGESVARALGREVRARRPGRRPRRGRDPRPPPDLRRCAARPHRAGHQGGRLDEPGRPARRGRQGRRRLPRRPGRGPARGARPGAEPHVPRPLPRARPGPVRRAVHRHRQRGRADPVGAAGPDGAGHPRRLHRGRQGRHRPRLPAAPTARAGRADAPTR